MDFKSLEVNYDSSKDVYISTVYQGHTRSKNKLICIVTKELKFDILKSGISGKPNSGF